MSSNRNINYLRRSSRVPRIPLAAEAASDATTTAIDVANDPPVTQRAATVNTTLTNDDTRVPVSKSKKKSRDYDKEVYTSDDDSDRDIRVKKSKLNSIESKTIDAMKNAATAVIFMNIFNLYCTQYRVDPSLKTIMDNGAASYELIQLLQPTHNESVKNNDKIEGETLNKLIARNFRSKTTVPVKTDYEATNTKMIEAYCNRNCNSVQDSIKNIEAIMSFSNVINPVYLIHGTAEVQLQYLRSILDNTIISLLKMVVPDWLQTDVAIKLNSQTDITECREAIAELVNNNADKFSKRKSLEPAFNAGDKFSIGKKQSNQAAPTQSSQSRPATYEAAAAKIKAEMLPILKNANNNKVDLNKINNGYIVFRKNKNLCLNCGYSNHQTEKCRVDPVNSKISQYHHLEDYDFSINKDSLYSLNSFYNQNISNELIKQTQQQDVHKNINKLKEYIKESYGIKLIPDTTVPIPESVKSEMKYKPKKIEFNTSTELPNVDDSNYIVNIVNPKRNNSDKKVINDDKDELLYTVKFDKETDKPIISLLHSTSSSDPILIPTLKCLIVPNKENMNKPRIIINSHTKEQQFKLILDTGSNVSLINKRLITNEMRDHVHKTKAKINFPLLDVKEEFVEQINIQINNDIHTFFIIELDIIDVLFGNDILKDSIINQKDKLIKLNNSTYKITYQQSDQLECNVKAPRKHITVSNDHQQSQSNNLLDDDDDIKEQVAKFVEGIPSQICDILVKSNPVEEEIQLLRDFINDSFEDVIVDKLPDIADQINNSKRGNIIHNIIIKKDQDVEPTKKQIYYSTDEHKRHVEEMVLKFIDLGIIKRSESNYSSPIMLLKKRDSWRVVHDYRQLNKVTVRDDHPFTPVDSLLNQCKDSKLFSKFDMIMGYFQVLINPEHAKYTAFITHIGKFEYTRMPQGLVNSPSTFARLMVEIFGKIKSLLQYFDDLLVHSKLDYKVHFIEIIRMLLYCRKYLLFISKEKSEMLKTEVDFLGFHIHKDGISPRAAKVRAISELPEPRNAKEAEAALGLFGFFRRHIENYAEKTFHLSKESKGKNKKKLSDESIKEFNNLKKEFEGENIVAIPIEQDNNTPIDIEKVRASTDMLIQSDNNNLNNGSFHLYCDVSDKALSGVLYQIQGDKFKVIWFHSRKLSDTQKRYSIGDREFLSIIDSLKKFQHLLIGKKVTIYTDHQNLTYIINKSNDKPFTKRQDNYMKYIKEFDYELRHISGKKNGIADFLSRKYDNFQWDESFLNKIKEEQINSQWLLEMKKNPNLCIEEINDICYLSEDGFKKLIIIDKETIHTIIREYHDTKYSGHHALDITYNNIRQDYYFKEMFSIIKRYIKSCAICQLNINRKDNGILQSLEIPFEVWRDISIDFLSLPKTNYALNGFTVEVDQVCVIVCRLSKMVHIVPCHKTIDAEHTAQLLLNHVFRLHGYPRTIVSDRDPRFLSDIWGRWAKTMDSKLKMSVAHRAQADGQTERMNREIIRILTKASTEYGENWSDIIPLIEFAMNSSMSKSTKMSPFQIVYGFNPPTPVNHFNSLTKTRIPMSNIKKIVRDNILDAQVNAQKYYNKGRGDVIFVVGEKVLVKRKFFQTNLSKDLISHKLESKNCGPFIITAIHGNNVTLDLVGYPKKHNVFNKDQIVKLYEDSEWLRDEISMPEPEEMDEASYEVESILNHDKIKKMYLVKFKGYPEPEWIKEVDTDCEELVREYWNNVQKKQLNSRRGRENATPEAIEPIVPSPLSQEVQNSQISLPTTPINQNLNSINQKTKSKKRKSRNQNTCSDDELDLSLQITTTRSGRKVTPKRL
ncbi:hypothetical protein ACTFIZ_011967 [Dictyostelium cf. discoideum]